MADERLTARPSLRQLRANLPDSVVILPTAAPRQVQQPCNRVSRQARNALRAETGERFAFKHPSVREAERSAAIMRNAGKDPGLILAHALLAEMDRESRAKVVERLARTVHHDSGRAAFEFARTTILNVGQQLDLMRALDAAD